MSCISGFKFPVSGTCPCTLPNCLSSPTQIGSPTTTWSLPGANKFSTFDATDCSGIAIQNGTLICWGDIQKDDAAPFQPCSNFGNTWSNISAYGRRIGSGIKTDGTLWTWGKGYSGSLGINKLTQYESSPVQTVAGGSNWRQSSVARDSVAATKTDGTLWLWGRNSVGQLGSGNTIYRSSPVQTISGGTNWARVSMGSYVTAAIKTDGTLWLWGRNNYGQLSTTGGPRSSPIQVSTGGTNWSLVDAGLDMIGATKTDGTLWMWGANRYGNLGTNCDITFGQSSPVQTIAGGSNWCHVNVPRGDRAVVVATKSDGTLWTWGRNNYCQIGDGTAISRSSPVQTITGGTNWCLGASRYNFTMAIKQDGTLWGWGRNYNRQASGGKAVIGIPCNSQTDFDDVFVRREFFSDGGLWIWGNGTDGRLGTNNTTNQSSPVQTISGGTNWRIISAGYRTSGGIKSDGTLWTWGYNNSMLGTGSTSPFTVSSPVQTVSGGTNWSKVTVGSRHMAAIKTDGTLWVWGQNSRGVLGTNNTTGFSSPVQTISGGANWAQVCMGYESIAAIKTDGTLWNWGLGFCGALGNLAINDLSSPVQTISGGTNWKQVSVGRSNKAAIKTDGTLWGWGRGDTLGNGDSNNIDQSSPVQTISGGTNWKQVASAGGSYMTAAIKTDGTLWLWGSNFDGTLGNNCSWPALARVSSPVQTVSGGTNWKCVSVTSAVFNCTAVAAIKTDGTLWTWGRTCNGNLGNNSNVNVSSPVQTVSGGTTWIRVSVGAGHMMGLREGCW